MLVPCSRLVALEVQRKWSDSKRIMKVDWDARFLASATGRMELPLTEMEQL